MITLFETDRILVRREGKEASFMEISYGVEPGISVSFFQKSRYIEDPEDVSSWRRVENYWVVIHGLMHGEWYTSLHLGGASPQGGTVIVTGKYSTIAQAIRDWKLTGVVLVYKLFSSLAKAPKVLFIPPRKWIGVDADKGEFWDFRKDVLLKALDSARKEKEND